MANISCIEDTAAIVMELKLESVKFVRKFELLGKMSLKSIDVQTLSFFVIDMVKIFIVRGNQKVSKIFFFVKSLLMKFHASLL